MYRLRAISEGRSGHFLLEYCIPVVLPDQIQVDVQVRLHRQQTGPPQQAGIDCRRVFDIEGSDDSWPFRAAAGSVGSGRIMGHLRLANSLRV